jgi:hypothetical protein
VAPAPLLTGQVLLAAATVHRSRGQFATGLSLAQSASRSL